MATTNQPRRRCFISAPFGADTSPLRAELEERQVDWVDGASAQPVGGSIVATLSSAIADADFVCGVLADDEANEGVVFELGLAVGAGKPTLVFMEPNTPFPLPLVALPYARATLNDTEALRFHLDAFLKNAGRTRRDPTPAEQAATNGPTDTAAFDEARHQISQWKTDGAAPSDRELAELLAKVFESSGAVASTARQSEHGADLAVWIDDLEANVGNPVLVEVVVNPSRLAVGQRHLRQIVTAGTGMLGIVVTWGELTENERFNQVSFPLILTFSAEDILRAIFDGTFVAEVRHRRNQLVHGAARVAG